MGGQTYTVTFDGMKDIMYTATALEPVVCDGGIVNMLEFTENIGELLSIRVIKATVTAQLTGLEMTGRCRIKFKNGRELHNHKHRRCAGDGDSRKRRQGADNGRWPRRRHEV